ncbi:hypothetical protein M9H77_26496 [Catharanthus roseus]|uniref:Uncharacterized protein n=1 Tax=Catharanthus roseus TaxID=4058 RepID=A0ACC0A9W3_CATRO|nr:hypothetical protein M9H77_26496 [Catharanthus roseus]
MSVSLKNNLVKKKSKEKKEQLYLKRVRKVDEYHFSIANDVSCVLGIEGKGRSMEKDLGTILEELPDSSLHSGFMFDPSCYDFGVMNNASIESIVVGFGFDVNIGVNLLMSFDLIPLFIDHALRFGEVKKIDLGVFGPTANDWPYPYHRRQASGRAGLGGQYPTTFGRLHPTVASWVQMGKCLCNF